MLNPTHIHCADVKLPLMFCAFPTFLVVTGHMHCVDVGAFTSVFNNSRN